MKHETNLTLYGDGRLQLGGFIAALLDFAIILVFRTECNFLKLNLFPSSGDEKVGSYMQNSTAPDHEHFVGLEEVRRVYDHKQK
jgi:hypothetical protein